jgi:hypothetical protein
MIQAGVIILNLMHPKGIKTPRAVRTLPPISQINSHKIIVAPLVDHPI